MAMFVVDPEQVAASAARVTGTGERIRGEVAAMMADLVSLQGSWAGVASANFTECTAQWRVTQAQVEAALDAIGAQLAVAAGTYADAESRSASLFLGR
ncbi:WXG100 family type VII secretion target [Actinomyces polynesiensis]|uniref:WXG100 family type VII secretion target n=1 Tax=Actinomyces polynesiensis TaxID=1325934 RepID=UPI0005B9E35D|nr:WXG100 family type VII secretion target [Actinomyces polynesiensis]